MSILTDTERRLDEVQKKKDEAIFAELAKLSPVEFDRIANSKAKALKITVPTLRAEVKKRRKNTETPEQTADTLEEEWSVEPYESEVDGADLLDSIMETFDKHLVLPEHGSESATLWTVGTYCHESSRFSPRLCYKAPEKGCGKTEALEVHHELVYRPLKFENITTATAFRLIAKHTPTLLLDEFDTYLGKRENDELRGILNAGYQKGGKVPRCEGDNNDVKFYPVFAPIATAGIGDLPPTLLDRSIVIRMKRAKRGEIRERLNIHKQAKRFQKLRSKIKRWVDDNESEILSAEPNILTSVAFKSNEMVQPKKTLLWAIPETARQLGDVSPRTVRRLLDRGELPKVKIGRTVRIPAQAVHDWVAHHTELADNGLCAGPDVRGGKSICGSVEKTEMVYTKDSTRLTTGRRLWTPAADELGALLGFGNPEQEGKTRKRS